MDFVRRTLRWQRVILATVLLGSAVGFWRATYDVFNTFKATIIVTGVLAMLAVAALRVSRTRRVLLPITPLWAPVGLFAVGLVVATAVSATPWLSLVGRPGRHTGLALYLAYVVVFGLVLRLYRDRSPAPVAKTVMAAAVPITVYGLAQAVGFEPFGWRSIEGGPQVFATFGNANFYSAYLGVAVPLYVWGALTRRWSGGWRVASALGGGAALVAALSSHSLQGPAIAVVGAAFVAAVWLLATADGLLRRLRAPLLACVGAGTVGLFAGVAAGVGPLGWVRAAATRSLETRAGKWDTALRIFADHPLAGVGLDAFGDYFHAYRPLALAAETGLRRTTDTPHNVPLDMLANGGLLLAVPYLLFVAGTAWALAVGLRRLAGEDRLLLGGLGGAWLAYQLQALVSIDVPPLALLHWVLSGAVVAYGTAPPVREWVLPGAPRAPRVRPGTRRRARERAAPLRAPNPAVLAVLAVCSLGALWLALLPLRADMAAAEAVRLAAAQQPQAAAEAYERAARLAPWESRYPALHAAYLAELGLAEEALARHQLAAGREPRGLAHAINLGRLSALLGDDEQADRWYDYALELDPSTPEMLVEVGRHRLDRDDADGASALLERAVALRDDEADWWVALGQARSAEGDIAGARQAFERALAIDPDASEAADALERQA